MFYKEYNLFSVRFNSEMSNDFNNYINKITGKLIKVANINQHGGWLFHIDLLKSVEKHFENVIYENESFAPPWAEIGMDLKYEPYTYQKEAIYNILETNETLLVLPCGSGKSLILIGAYHELLKAKKIKGQGLVLVKASLKIQWSKEVPKFSNYTANVLKTYADRCGKFKLKHKKLEKELQEAGFNKSKVKDINKRIKLNKKEAKLHFAKQFENADILVANYETLLDENVLKILRAKELEFISGDEIQYVKSKDSKRSKALYKLSNTKYKIGATATPITKDPQDVYGIFKFINPLALGTYESFSYNYIKTGGFGKIVGFKNIEELRDKIANNVFLKTKEEVASQLPSLHVIERYIDLEQSQVTQFERILEELEELNNKDFEIRRRCKSEAEALLNEELQQISGKVMALQTFAQETADAPELLTMSESNMSKEYAVSVKSNNKLDETMEIISQVIDSGEKICIFSKFIRMQDIFTREIKKQFPNVDIAYINGALSGQQRYVEAYDKFRDTDSYKVLLCGDSGAEGLNLSRCKYLIEYEPATSYAIQTQRHGRLERSDSVHDNVTVYQLIGNNSWDEIQKKVISKKQNFDEDIIKSIAK